MRTINLIVVHCSATPQGLDIGAREIDAMHRARGFTMIGYHEVITLDGNVEQGRPHDQVGAHAVGHNTHSIGICLVGGLNLARKPANTYTEQQLSSLETRLRSLMQQFPGARVLGHRDLSPDKNRNGKVDRHEWVKDCPCFDVAEWMAERGLAQTTN